MPVVAIPIIGWVVGPIITKLINISYEYLKGKISKQKGMKKKLEKLQENLPEIQSVVDYATQAQFGDQNPALNDWLWKLRDAIEEADDLLEEIEFNKHKKQVAKNNWKTKVPKLPKIGKGASKKDLILNRLEEVVNKFDEVSAKVDTFLHLVKNAKQEQQKQQDDFHKNRVEGSLPKNVLIGRGEDMKSVIRWLRQTSNEEHPTHIASTAWYNSISIFSIVGRWLRQTSNEEHPTHIASTAWYSSISIFSIVGRWLRQTSNEEHPTHIASTALYNNVSVLSIVGHGGMGKTTLLQHVYEDEITKEFDIKMWVCISINFDVNTVIKNILESLKKQKYDLESLDALQDCLKSEVSSKKFLLVLDDIWDEDERKWEKVLAPLAYGKLGSKILVTTRMDSPAEMITKVIKKKKETLSLQGLKDDECLELLNTHAFAGVENPDNHKKLRSITVDIARKLSGSPLAAKVIGGALNSSFDERHWITILKSDFGNAEFGQNGILPILRLSYTFLPRHLQNCFAFCSIFPQYHNFDKDDLVRMWIALGFIQSSANQEETVEDIGGKYFDALVKKSFFYELRTYYATYYKMHDLLHELAKSISAQESFSVVRDKELHSRIPETIRYLSVKTRNLDILKKIEKFKRLRSLFLSTDLENQEIVDVLTKIFQSLRSIRLLYIKSDSVRLIPEAIGSLVHLRYLQVYSWGFKGTSAPVLPSSLSNLYHLQFMIYKENRAYKTYPDDFLPRDMNNLFNLRYLKLPNDCFHMIPEIGKLHFLQNMNVFSVKDEIGYSIQELQHMNELRQLRIKLLENVKDAEQACKAKLYDKRNLTDLSLEWGDVSYHKGGEFIQYRETMRKNVDLDLDERVLDKLQPHSCLRELRIHAFMGVRSPNWLNNSNLMSNLEYIQLDRCLEWKTLPPFGKLPFLKSLHLLNMPKTKSIDYNEEDCVFPSLEQLHIEGLDALEDWFDATITDDCLFPCLIELYLKGCPNLKELPCLPPKLKSLHIREIGWKTLSCRSISNSIPLEELSIFRCPNITCISLADSIKRFAALRNLEIDLISLRGHQEVGTTENCRLTLDNLHIRDPSMLLMEPLRSIASLKVLSISSTYFELIRYTSYKFVSFPSEVEQWFLQVSSSLFQLEFRCLRSLRFLPSYLESLSSLKRIIIDHVPELQVLPNFPASLGSLYLYRLESLQCLPSSLSTISSLKSLAIDRVPLLQQLPDLPFSLEYLYIRGCHEELKKRYNKISGFDRDKLAHIRYVHIF